MVKNTYDVISSGLGTDETDVPAGSEIIESSENNLDVMEFVADNEFGLNNLDEFIHYDFNGNPIFYGVIRTNKDGEVGKRYGFDYSIELGEIRIRKNFEDMTPLEIMEDVITNFTGLTWVANPAIVDGAAIELYPSQNKKAITIVNDMHKLLGTTHYMSVRNFNIEYEGDESNTNILEVGVNCQTDETGWIQDTDQLCKNITVNGGDYDTTETIFLSGDGVTQTFSIDNPYVDITVEYPIGTELKPQLTDITSGDYEVFKETKKIKFTSITPASGTNNIKVIYTYKNQSNFTINEVTSTQILAGINPHHQILNIEYLKSVTECQNYAYKYRNKFNKPLRTVTLLLDEVDKTKYRANQKIRVIDNIHKVNGEYVDDDTFIIKEVRRSFGNNGYFLVLVIGDSNQFVFDRVAEIGQKIIDLNEKVPKAEIFNEGIPLTTTPHIEIQYDVDVQLLVGTLPSDVLVYDASRTYTNAADVGGGGTYRYINYDEYVSLFDDVDIVEYVTQTDEVLITQSGESLILD